MNSDRVSRWRAGWIALSLLVAAGPGVFAHEAKAERARPCSQGGVRGSFGYYRTGTTPDGPLAAVGRFYLDGNGHALGSQLISHNGEFEDREGGVFLYEIDADCRGRFLDEDGGEIARLSVVDGGKTIYMLSESEGNTVYGVATAIQ